MKLVPPMQELSVVHLDLAADWRVIAFTMLIALVAGVCFGLLPAFKSSKVDVLSTLKEDARTGCRKVRVRNVLVVTQVAVSLTLLAGASFCLRSLSNAQSINPGFDPHHRVMISLNPELVGYSETRGRTFYRELLDRIAVTHGVQSASLVSWLPLGFSSLRAPAYIDGVQYSPTSAPPFVAYTRVAPGYFAAMGIPLLRGRDFASTDTDKAPGVVIVNEEFARRFWPGDNPLGKHIVVNLQTHDSLEVVGVAQTGKYRTLSERPQAFMYWPLLRYYSARATLVIQTVGSDASMLATVKQEIQRVDPYVPIVDAGTLDGYMSVPLFSARLTASLLGAFGLLALALAAAGLYSAVAYSVSQRTHEIGIRMALGARRWDVLWQIIREGGRLALLGVGIGSAGAVVLGRLIASLLYGVSAADPLVLTSAALVWISIALVASYIPARRAVNLDPLITLRYE
jgi:predicted permease